MHRVGEQRIKQMCKQESQLKNRKLFSLLFLFLHIPPAPHKFKVTSKYNLKTPKPQRVFLHVLFWSGNIYLPSILAVGFGFGFGNPVDV